MSGNTGAIIPPAPGAWIAKTAAVSALMTVQELPRCRRDRPFWANLRSARQMLPADVESGHEGPAKGEYDVANLEQRVTTLEGQADTHTIAVNNLRKEMFALRSELRGDMVALRTELRSDIGGLRTDLGELSRRTDRFFIWLAGTQVATLLAVIGVLVGILYR